LGGGTQGVSQCAKRKKHQTVLGHLTRTTTRPGQRESRHRALGKKKRGGGQEKARWDVGKKSQVYGEETSLSKKKTQKKKKKDSKGVSKCTRRPRRGGGESPFRILGHKGPRYDTRQGPEAKWPGRVKERMGNGHQDAGKKK